MCRPEFFARTSNQGWAYPAEATKGGQRPHSPNRVEARQSTGREHDAGLPRRRQPLIELAPSAIDQDEPVGARHCTR